MTIALIILAALMVGTLAIAFGKKLLQPKEPSGWFAGPIISGQNYSSPIAIGADGSFTFPTSEPGVHYITKACSSLATAKGITLHYRIDADPGVQFLGAKDHQPVTQGPYLYFQRAGDDWSASGEFEAYRWWASFTPGSLTPGKHEISVTFDQDWTAIMTSHAKTNPQGFNSARSNAARIGFTFPNHEGLGHGCYATGRARFTVLEFDIV